MNSPFDSVASLAAASQLVPVDAIPVQPVSHIGAHSPPMDELAQRFSSLMNAPQATEKLLTSSAKDSGEELLRQIQTSQYMGVRC